MPITRHTHWKWAVARIITAAAIVAGTMTIPADAASAHKVQVNGPEAGVYSHPYYNGSILIKTKKYEECVEAISGTVLSRGQEWFKVALAGGGSGWMRVDLIINPGKC